MTRVSLVRVLAMFLVVALAAVLVVLSLLLFLKVAPEANR